MFFQYLYICSCTSDYTVFDAIIFYSKLIFLSEYYIASEDSSSFYYSFKPLKASIRLFISDYELKSRGSLLYNHVLSLFSTDEFRSFYIFYTDAYFSISLLSPLYEISFGLDIFLFSGLKLTKSDLLSILSRVLKDCECRILKRSFC